MEGVLRSSEREDRIILDIRRTPHLRRTPIFDLRIRRTRNPLSSILGAEARRTSPSSIFGLRPRRSKNPPSSIRSSAPKIGPKIGRKMVGATSSKMGGLLRIFSLGSNARVMPPSSILGAGRTKNSSHLPPSRAEERRTHLFFLLPTPLRPILTRSSQLS